MKFKDLTGNKYGRLTVLGVSHKDKHGMYYWNCVCECGNTNSVARSALQQGATKSCGCFAQENRVNSNTTHGMSKTPVYAVWHEMVNRATNPKHKHSKYYSERGISVSNDWLEFENFYRDMGDRPEGSWLERVDNSEGYSKENCVWSDVSSQCSNRRSLKNTSGRIGVYWESEVGRWKTSMIVKGKQVAGKRFDDYQEACNYIEKLELDYLGYSRSEGFIDV